MVSFHKFYLYKYFSIFIFIYGNTEKNENKTIYVCFAYSSRINRHSCLKYFTVSLCLIHFQIEIANTVQLLFARQTRFQNPNDLSKRKIP